MVHSFLFCRLIPETQMHQSILLIEGNNFKIEQVIDDRQYVKEGSAHSKHLLFSGNEAICVFTKTNPQIYLLLLNI